MSRLADVLVWAFLGLLCVLLLGVIALAGWACFVLGYLGLMVGMPVLFVAICFGTALCAAFALWHLTALLWTTSWEFWVLPRVPA